MNLRPSMSADFSHRATRIDRDWRSFQVERFEELLAAFDARHESRHPIDLPIELMEKYEREIEGFATAGLSLHEQYQDEVGALEASRVSAAHSKLDSIGPSVSITPSSERRV